MLNDKSKMCNCSCHDSKVGKVLHCRPCCDYTYQKRNPETEEEFEIPEILTEQKEKEK